MKNFIIIGLALVLSTACQRSDKRYSQNSPEIDTVKQLIANYNSKTYDTSIYADSSKTYYNTTDDKKVLSPNETMAYHKQNDAVYSHRKFLDEDQEYEMVVTDDGETWVNCWLDWQGTMKATGKTIDIPIHLTYRFEDGKIVREVGRWDPTEVVFELQEIERRNQLQADSKKILKNISDFIQIYLNKKDPKILSSVLAKDYKRYIGGHEVAAGAKGLQENLKPFFDGFPDLKISYKTPDIIGNDIFVNWTFTGTNTGEFNGQPATGKKVVVNGLSELSFNKDGKMLEERLFFDQLEVMTQLGHSLQ